MTAQKKSIPDLRFPQFGGEWHAHELGEFIDERKEVASSNLPLYSLTIDAGIVPKPPRYERSFLVQSEDSAYKRMQPKDFAYNPMNLRWGALACHHGSIEIAVSKYYDVFSVNEKSVPEYLEPFFTSYKMLRFYNRMATGTLQEKKRVHYLDFVHFKKLFPALPEQRKIADFLAAVGARMGQLVREKALLEDYRRGVMQRLFAQTIRFKDDQGDDFPDWEEKKLREVATCLDHLRRPVNAAERKKMKGDIPYYGANGIQGYVNDFLFDEDLVLLAEDGGNFDEFTTRPIAQRVIGKAWVNNHAHILRANRAEMTPDFLFHSLVNKDIRKYVNVSSRAKLNKGDMLTIAMMVPKVLEQTKITNFLSAIDRKITVVATQLIHTQAFHKGLTQQLFV